MIVSVPSGPRVVAGARILVMPDVEQIELRCDNIESLNSALSWFRVAAEFIQSRIRKRVEIAANDVVVGRGKEGLKMRVKRAAFGVCTGGIDISDGNLLAVND